MYQGLKYSYYISIVLFISFNHETAEPNLHY
jgi:hypothetical protein